jgi:predicted nuclease of restriction endonuclease-like (RecB) superfamily
MLSDKSVSSVLTQIPQGVFKDPYIFEFLNLPDVHSEKDFEQALIKNLQKFILEILCKPLHNNSYAYRFVM